MQNCKVKGEEHCNMEERISESELQRFQVLFGRKYSLTSVSLRIVRTHFSNGKGDTRLQKRWREKMVRT